MLQENTTQLRARGYGSCTLPILLLLWGIYSLFQYGHITIPISENGIPFTPLLTWAACAVCLISLLCLMLLLRPWQKELPESAKKRLTWTPLVDIFFGISVAVLLYLAIY